MLLRCLLALVRRSTGFAVLIGFLLLSSLGFQEETRIGILGPQERSVDHLGHSSRFPIRTPQPQWYLDLFSEGTAHKCRPLASIQVSLGMTAKELRAFIGRAPDAKGPNFDTSICSLHWRNDCLVFYWADSARKECFLDHRLDRKIDRDQPLVDGIMLLGDVVGVSFDDQGKIIQMFRQSTNEDQGLVNQVRTWLHSF
jgi:hypothetical protein